MSVNLHANNIETLQDRWDPKVMWQQLDLFLSWLDEIVAEENAVYELHLPIGDRCVPMVKVLRRRRRGEGGEGGRRAKYGSRQFPSRRIPPGKFHPGIFPQGMFPPDMFPP